MIIMRTSHYPVRVRPHSQLVSMDLLTPVTPFSGSVPCSQSSGMRYTVSIFSLSLSLSLSLTGGVVVMI